MDVEKQKLGHLIIAQLANGEEQIKKEIADKLNREWAATTFGANRGGITVTAAELEEISGPELWANILEEKAALEAFVNS